MTSRLLLRRFGLLLGLIIISVLARIIITGGYPTVRLSTTPSSLAGPVSIGIGQATSGVLPEAGKDYKIESTKYFDGKEWVVVKILPLKTKADPAFIVLKKIDGVYQTVLGPDSQFDSSYFYVMPLDVGQYLAQQGAYDG